MKHVIKIFVVVAIVTLTFMQTSLYGYLWITQIDNQYGPIGLRFDGCAPHSAKQSIVIDGNPVPRTRRITNTFRDYFVFAPIDFGKGLHNISGMIVPWLILGGPLGRPGIIVLLLKEGSSSIVAQHKIFEWGGRLQDNGVAQAIAGPPQPQKNHIKIKLTITPQGQMVYTKIGEWQKFIDWDPSCINPTYYAYNR